MSPEELQRLLESPEGENAEFKPSLLSRKEIAEYAVGIGNAGGGWLIMGVSDRRPRRVLPFDIPDDSEIQRIRESVADAAQIHVMIERVTLAEGTALAVRIPARPRGIPFHTRDGKYLIRLGDGLRGLTLAELDAIRQEAGVEFTAQPVMGDWPSLVRPTGMEELRRLMRETNAPDDLIRQPDADLLRALGVVSDEGSLLVAGLLLVGNSDALRERIPLAQWQFFRMLSDTDYDLPAGGNDCITVALRRIRELVDANNPVTTIPGWFIHPEFPRYPALALRELLVNAFVHRDYQAPGSVTLKLYPDRLELSNPGGFMADLTPDNILHHPSVPRYPVLFSALARMRLANAANLGIPRVFRDLLSEGKEPPYYWTGGQTIRVTVKGQEPRREFLDLVQRHAGIDVDELLIVHYLTRHREISARQAGEICQRPIEDAREILGRLVSQWRLLEQGGGTGRGRYYRLSRATYDLLGEGRTYYVDRRISSENAKARVLAALEARALSNADVREITQMARYQCSRLMSALRSDGFVTLDGRGRGAVWRLARKSCATS